MKLKKSSLQSVHYDITRKDGFFYLPTSTNTLKFRDYDEIEREDTDGDKGYEYLGFYPSLQMHAVNSIAVAESLGFAELSLISNTIPDRYEIVSLSDWSVEMPVISPSKKFMVYWQNPVYESHLLQIAVLKIDKSSVGKNFLKEHAFAEIKTPNSIEEIRWKDDHHFIIKMFYPSSDEVKTFKYLSGEIR